MPQRAIGAAYSEHRIWYIFSIFIYHLFVTGCAYGLTILILFLVYIVLRRVIGAAYLEHQIWLLFTILFTSLVCNRLCLWVSYSDIISSVNCASASHRRSLFRTSYLIFIFLLSISLVCNRLCLWINYFDVISSVDCASASHRRSLFRTSNLIIIFYIFISIIFNTNICCWNHL